MAGLHIGTPVLRWILWEVPNGSASMPVGALLHFPASHAAIGCTHSATPFLNSTPPPSGSYTWCQAPPWIFFSTDTQVALRYHATVPTLETLMETLVGDVARTCAWPRCQHRAAQRILRLSPHQASKRGRPRLYCSESCRVAAQKRRRTLRAALNKIDDALATGAHGPPRSEIARWKDLVEWELTALDSAATPRPSIKEA